MHEIYDSLSMAIGVRCRDDASNRAEFEMAFPGLHPESGVPAPRRFTSFAALAGRQR